MMTDDEQRLFNERGERLDQYRQALTQLQAELARYQDGGVTEELLRKQDGYLKVGKGCVLVREDDWAAQREQVTDLQATGSRLVLENRELRAAVRRMEQRIANLRRGNSGQEKLWLQTKLGLYWKIEQLQAKLDGRLPNYGKGAKLEEVWHEWHGAERGTNRSDGQGDSQGGDAGTGAETGGREDRAVGSTPLPIVSVEGGGGGGDSA